MRLLITVALGLSTLYGQPCVSGRIQPARTIAAALTAGSCVLSDNTPYDSYRLDLPVRGQIQLDLDAGQQPFDIILRDASGARLGAGASIHQPIEAGDYTVLVNGRDPGLTGSYTLQTTFNAEAGMLCRNFPNLGMNQSVNGVLGSSGCLAPDGFPYEAYTLTALSSGNLTITVAGTRFTATVFLRDIDGRLLMASFTSLTAPVTAGTQYQVALSTVGGIGDYQLTTSFQPVSGTACQPQSSFTGSASDHSSITEASCWRTVDETGDPAYYNYYSVVIAREGTATLTAASSDFDPRLILLDGAGNTLADDSDGDPGGSGTSSADIRLHLMPGSYTAMVFSDYATGGDYTFGFDFVPGPPQACPLAALAMNAADGTLSVGSCRTELGPSDVYTMTLDSAGTVEVTVSSDQFIPSLAIRDGKDNLVVLARDTTGLGVAHVSADLPAGAYRVVPASMAGLGDYRLTAGFTAHPIQVCNSPTMLPLNGTYYQELSAGSCRGANGQPVDTFAFVLPTEGVIASVVASSDIDGFLTLTDADGNVLRSDDNTYGNNDPLIVQYLPAGTYHLVVRDAAGSLGGPYALALYVALGPRPPFCSTRAILNLGASVTGNINSAGCQYGDNTLADLYAINMPGPGTLDVHLDSGDFDAYLVLLDPKGQQVAADDDSGGGTNARIQKVLPAGGYYIVAKPFRDYFSQGDYALSVNIQTNQ